ncbi:MAG: hypothetical protein ACLP9S_04740 [Syntrophales bacterium]
MLDIKYLKEISNESEPEPIEVSLSELDGTVFKNIPEGISLNIFENDFPETCFGIEKGKVIVEITKHIYSKYWWHKYHASVFADAMIRAVIRLQSENHPFREATIESDEDIHIFVRWQLELPATIDATKLVESIKAANSLVWERANSILENSDSILILGKDTGGSLNKLKRIQSFIEELGYYAYIIKEQPDKLGESIIQKVLRYALSSKFIIIENSEPSGHLYEIPHITKMAESVSIILQAENEGATWIFEDAYFKHNHWKKFSYTDSTLEKVLKESIDWAEELVKKYGRFQEINLPWMNE